MIKDEINKIQDRESIEKITVAVSRGSLSKAIGQRKSNIIRLSQEFLGVNIQIKEDTQIPNDSVNVIVEKGNRDVFKIT
jgi:transcription antitermination factor NusA-like protein